MKTLAITATLVASVLASALTAQAAPRHQPLDGWKLFEDVANRAG